MTLTEAQKKTGPLTTPLRIIVAAVPEPYKYNSEKELLKLTVADGTAMCRAVVFDPKKFSHFRENCGLVIHNAIMNKDKEIVVTTRTRVFSSKAPDVPADLLRSAVELIRPMPPDVIAISDAKQSPTKTRVSIRGKIVNDSLATKVRVNSKEVDVRTITLDDGTDDVKVSLWRNLASQEVTLGDVVEITNVIRNEKCYNNEDSLSSTQYTKIEVTELPNKELTTTILGVEIGDVESSVVMENDGIFIIDNNLLAAEFSCPFENVYLLLPKEVKFSASGNSIESFVA